jgi:hypothetical protein
VSTAPLNELVNVQYKFVTFVKYSNTLLPATLASPIKDVNDVSGPDVLYLSIYVLPKYKVPLYFDKSTFVNAAFPDFSPSSFVNTSYK